MRRSPHVHQAGFTLIELMIGLAITSIIVFANAHFTLMGRLKYQESESWSGATLIADSLVERLHNVRRDDALISTGRHELHFSKTGRESAAPSHFRAEWDVMPLAAPAGMVQIEVRVIWKQLTMSRSVRFVTFRDGPT